MQWSLGRVMFARQIATIGPVGAHPFEVGALHERWLAQGGKTPGNDYMLLGP